MNKPRTLEEIYKEVGKFPFQVQHHYWINGCYFEVVAKIDHSDKCFCGFNEGGVFFSATGSTESWILISPIKEKKKVVRWLWADKHGHISWNLESEEEAKIHIPTYPIKLEWSKTVFEVE